MCFFGVVVFQGFTKSNLTSFFHKWLAQPPTSTVLKTSMKAWKWTPTTQKKKILVIIKGCDLKNDALESEFN